MQGGDTRTLRLFLKAVECPVQERSAWLERECSGDLALQALLVKLLEQVESEGALLPVQPPAERVAHLQDERDRRLVGLRLGRFEIQHLLGRGGAGSVFEALEAHTGRRVAIKIDLPPDNPGEVRRSASEARLLAQLRHPGLAQFLDSGRCADPRGYGQLSWFAMELVEGPAGIESILAYAQRTGADRDQKLGLLRQVAEAVGYVHSQGVVHRDLKDSNVLIGPDGRPKVIDFGIALWPKRLVGAAQQTLTAEGSLLGTMRSMAPEQLLGERSLVGPGTDVYALGLLLYELLTGDVPALSLRARGVPPPPPSKSDAGLPPDLDAICLRALAPKTGDRYASAAELAEDLRRHLGRQPLALGTRLWLPARRFWRRPQFQPLLPAGILCLGLGLGWLLWRSPAEPVVAAAEAPAPASAGLSSAQAQRLTSAGFEQLALGEHADAATLFEKARAEPALRDRSQRGLALAFLLSGQREQLNSLLDELGTVQVEADPLLGLLQADRLRQSGEQEQADALLARLPAERDSLDLLAEAALLLADPYNLPKGAGPRSIALLDQARMQATGATMLVHFMLANATVRWLQVIPDARSEVHVNEVQKLCDTLLARWGKQAIAWLYAGRLRHAVGQYDLALVRLEKARELGLEGPQLDLAFSRTLRRLGRQEESLELCRSALRAHPEDADLWNELGCVLNMMGDKEASIPSFQRALELVPQHSWALANLGVSYLDLKQNDQAIARLERAVECMPDQMHANHNLSCAYLIRSQEFSAAGETAAALEWAERASLLPNETAEVWSELGRLRLQLGRTEDALAALAVAARRLPASGEVQRLIGAAYLNQGLLPAAKAALVDSIHLEPENAAAHYDLALCCARGGDSWSALTWLAEALQRRPELAGQAAGESDFAALRQDPQLCTRFDQLCAQR